MIRLGYDFNYHFKIFVWAVTHDTIEGIEFYVDFPLVIEHYMNYTPEEDIPSFLFPLYRILFGWNYKQNYQLTRVDFYLAIPPWLTLNVQVPDAIEMRYRKCHFGTEAHNFGTEAHNIPF